MLGKTRTISTPDRRKRRKRVFLLKTIAGMFGFALLVGSSSWLAHRESFLVSDISVSGNIVVRERDIKATARKSIEGKRIGLIPKSNIAFVPLPEIEKMVLAEHSRLASVKVSRSKGRALSVVVTERSPAFLWCGEGRSENNENCYFLDEKGYVFSPAPYFSGNIFVEFYGPLVRDRSEVRVSPDMASAGHSISERRVTRSTLIREGAGAYFLEEEDFQDILVIIEAFEDVGIIARRIALNDDRDVFVDTSDGATVIFSLEDDPAAVIRDVEAALSSPIFSEGTLRERLGTLESIDVRFGNKVYYKLVE